MNRYLSLKQEKHDLAVEARGLDLATDEGRARLGEIEARMTAVDADLLVEERRREVERNAEPVARPAVSDVRDLATEKPWASLGEQLLAVRAASVPGGAIDPRLKYQAQLGANVGVGSEGGFLLDQGFVSELWQRVYGQSALLSRTFRVPIGNDQDSTVIPALAETSRVTGSRWGGIQAYWVAEAGNLTPSQAAFRRMRFSPHKLAVLTYATPEMLRNPATLESVINQLVPQEIAWMSENAMLRGVGGGQPLGILNSAVLIPVPGEPAQLAGTIVSENISNMWSRMWARSRPNAIWLINQDCEPQLDQLSMQVGVGGVPTYMPPGGLADAPYGRLKGRPVVPVEYCSTVGTVGDIVLADWSQYGTSDRGTGRSDSSIHVQFLTDQVAYRFIYELDGQSLWDAPLTPANGTNTLSPFVALATR